MKNSFFTLHVSTFLFLPHILAAKDKTSPEFLPDFLKFNMCLRISSTLPHPQFKPSIWRYIPEIRGSYAAFKKFSQI